MGEHTVDPLGPKLPRHFDVVCVGESFWKVGHHTPSGPGLRPGGGAVSVALNLAAKGLRVGLATVLSADALGRKARLVLKGAGVDTSGVVLAAEHDKPWRMAVRPEARGELHHDEATLGVPEGWSAPTLVLSGLSPQLLQASALCRAARAARRAGALSLIDFNANRSVWNGRDARNILMVLREVDVARASIADLAVLGMDLRQVRRALRPDAVLVMTDHHGRSIAMGPFCEVSVPRRGPAPKARGAGDSFTAALSAELSRPSEASESAADAWRRALRNSHGALRVV